jgi:transcription termination/antitermination protein NusA
VNQELVGALRELAREKGIPFEMILSGLEEAMASAYKSWRRQQDPDLDEDLFGTRAVMDPETGDLRIWEQELDEEGNALSENEVEVTDEFKGRIGAQTAKQVIYQKLRDAERELTYEEFAGREGDVVTGIIQQDSHRFTLLDLGKVEALLPQAEQVPSEMYRHGDRLTAYITEVRRGTKGPQIIVSRTHPGLLRKMFELEVPEIEEGIVEIKAVAREPGHRSKIAVSSNEPAVDPVGACVGAKGSRVRMVVNQLKGEKIDVVPWSPDPSQFVANALQPAKVKEVRIDPATQTAMVIVPDYQLSLAIGKEGQNARLAARLTGWRIDIKSETQFAEEGRRPASTPVTPDATDAAAPEGAPEAAAEAGGPTEAPQPAPLGEEAGLDTTDAAEAAERATDEELPPGTDEYVEDADAAAEAAAQDATEPGRAAGDGPEADVPAEEAAESEPPVETEPVAEAAESEPPVETEPVAEAAVEAGDGGSGGA